MTKNDALRLALEALENLGNHDRICPQWPTYVEPENYPKCNCGYDQAITAIKAALANEALERKAENARELGLDYEPLEAKDEPVAWRDAAIRLGEELSSVGPDGYYDMDAKKWLDWAMKQNPKGEHSLPQRTWVGLTLEEIESEWGLFMSGQGSGYIPDFAKALETKLKEKNT